MKLIIGFTGGAVLELEGCDKSDYEFIFEAFEERKSFAELAGHCIRLSEIAFWSLEENDR